jgi:hypothetical protein
MGDRLIAASNAYKRAPADNSEPVLIDALPSLNRDLPDHAARGRRQNAVEAEAFPHALKY